MDMQKIDGLMDEIRRVSMQMNNAYDEYDLCDNDMTDYCIFKIKSLESKYKALSRRLKNNVFPGQGMLDKQMPKTLWEKIVDKVKE